jgi:Uma2 family endonuclease
MSTIARFSLAEFDRMIERQAFDPARHRRIELIFGEMREVNPPGPSHEVIVDRLTKWSVLKAPQDRVCVRIQNSIGAEEIDSAPQPDIAWVKDRDYLRRRPQASDVFLVIEVSHSSLGDDRDLKAGLYALARVKDYWIVNLCDLCVEVHRKPRSGKYREVRVYGFGESVAPLAFPEVALDVSNLFSGVKAP